MAALLRDSSMSNSVIPSIPFIGVLISCDISAMNLDLKAESRDARILLMFRMTMIAVAKLNKIK